MEWRHGGSPRPKKFRVQKSAGKFLASIFFFFGGGGIKTAFSSLIIFQRAKLATRSITNLCWCDWRTFWRKNTAGSSPRVSCSCTTMPQLTGHLQQRRNLLTWASSVVITYPILRIWPRRTTTYSLDWKNNWKVAVFRPTQRVIAAADTWLDGQLSEFFFWLACKGYSNGLRSVLSFVGSMLNKSRVWSP